MSLELDFFDDARPFHAAVTPFAVRAEAENNLIIGLSAQLIAGTVAAPEPPLLLLVRDAGEIVGAAFRTVPFPIVLSTMAPGTAREVAARLRAREVTLTGAIGPSDVASAFTAAWHAPGAAPPVFCAMRVYRLDQVLAAPPTPGGMVAATADDFERVMEWRRAFASETHERAAADPEIARRRIDAGEIMLWRDGAPVAMAGFGGPTPNGIRVNLVYTPPEFRRRGYATALVSEMSRRLLAGGRRFCFLFTDLANPTSNGVYQRIGYRPVCDFADYRFA